MQGIAWWVWVIIAPIYLAGSIALGAWILAEGKLMIEDVEYRKKPMFIFKVGLFFILLGLSLPGLVVMTIVHWWDVVSGGIFDKIGNIVRRHRRQLQPQSQS